MLKIFRVLSPGKRRSTNVLNVFTEVPGHCRTFADKPPPLDSKTKQIVVHGCDASRVRVRRARPSDVPRLLRFVRENSRTAWPSLLSDSVAPNSAAQLVLGDYVSRALAQGHSMIAEQVGARRGLLTVRGLALGAALCPWDSALLERWARCLRCSRSRRLLHFTAHCIRGPELHDKYHVQKILQVILIVPPDAIASPEIVQTLAKGAVQRGQEAGFPLLRFDVTNEDIAKTLENLNLKKEWRLSYDVVPAETIAEGQAQAEAYLRGRKNNFVAVYSTLTSGSPLVSDSAKASPILIAAKPDPASTKPNPASAKPAPASAKLDPASAKLNPAPAKPDPPSSKPDPTPAKPDPTSGKLDSAPAKPDIASTKADVTTAKPDIAPDYLTTKLDPTTIQPDPIKPSPSPFDSSPTDPTLSPK